MNPSPARRAFKGDRPFVFVELLLRAALALPLVLLGIALMLALLSAAITGPVAAFVWIWQGDVGWGAIALVVGAVAMIAFRALWRRIWEMPPSFL